MRENGKHSQNVAQVTRVHEMPASEFAAEELRWWGVSVRVPYPAAAADLEELRMMLHTAAQNWCHGMNRKRILER